MTILTAKNTPRVTYTASGSQTAFTIPFEFFNVADIKVYNGTTLLTYQATPDAANKYSITGTASSSDSAYEFGAGGTITLGGSGASASDIITIIRDITIERSSDFPTSGSFDIASLNTDLDKVYAKLADIDQQTDRSVKLLDTDSIAATVALPAKATRASKVLTFDSDGDVQTSIAAVDVTTIAGIASNVTTVAGISSNVTSVAGNATNINTVAGSISNVNAVGGISSDVTSVAGIASNVTTVAGKASLITSDFATDMSLVTSDFVSDMNLVTADFISDVNTLATADIVSDLNLLATSDFVSDLNQLATTDFVSDLNALEAIKANVTTVANNVSGINDFADRYRVGSSDPSSDNDAGDLIYNTTSNSLKVWTGSAFATINTSGGLANVVEDTTPQLGGHLDGNSKNITSLGTINTHTIPGGTGTFALTSDITFTTSSTDTLTNKTLTSPVISSISNTGTITLPTSTDTLVGRATTDTLTNKTINTASNTITITESDISDLGSYITASSSDTLTNKSGNVSMFTNDSNFITSTVTGDFIVDTDTLKVDSTNNRVGIGQATPTKQFEINNSGDTELLIKSGTSSVGKIFFGDADSSSSGLIEYGHTANDMGFYVNGSRKALIESDGDLHVDGDVIAYSTTVPSDIALKTDVQMIPNALDKIDEVRGVTFKRYDGEKSAGVIAQDLEKVLPEAVHEKEFKLLDGKKYKTVQYDAIHGLLINCIKELKEQIKELKNGFTK